MKDRIVALLSQFLSRIIITIARLNRVQVVLLVFVFFGFIILSTAFRFSVLHHSYYKTLADNQQTLEIKDPVSRGTITSDNDPPGIFAVSTSLPDLAVDPQEKGSKERLATFLSEILFDEFCTYDMANCAENVGTFIRMDDTQTLPDTQEAVTALIKNHITERISRTYVDTVALGSVDSDTACATIAAWQNEGVGCLSLAVWADPTRVRDVVGLTSKLSPLIHKTSAEIADSLKLRPLRYVKLARRLNLRSKEKIDDRVHNEKDAIAKGLLDEKDSILRFIILDPVPTRFYPERYMGGQIIGFVDHANQWRYGIEGYFNRELSGKEGSRVIRKDVSGRTVGGFSLEENELVAGADITLTIDRNIQKEITKILRDALKEYKANRVTAVVMEPQTGAVRAMVSAPDFDPNEFGDVYAMERVRPGTSVLDLLGKPVFVEDSTNGEKHVFEGRDIALRAATDDELANYAVPKYKFQNDFGPGVYVSDAIGSLYEPGSVFKSLTVAIALDTGDIRPSDMYNDRGFVEIDRFKIHNADNVCTGYHTYLHALDWSCNVGMISIVDKVGPALFSKYIQDFGLGEKTNITLEGEVFGRLEPYEKWSRTKLFTMSFGQGIVATPLQMAAAYNVLANGGVYMEPYIVENMKLSDGRVIHNTAKSLRRVISEATSKTITAMLVDGVRFGFAKTAGVLGYDIAGKSGTSQIAARGRYEVGTAGHTVTSFGGYAPANNPKFVLIVKIDRPRTAVYSETTSSALFAKITQYLLNYYRIPKQDDNAKPTKPPK